MSSHSNSPKGTREMLADTGVKGRRRMVYIPGIAIAYHVASP